jgi:hypothetical protein
VSAKEGAAALALMERESVVTGGDGSDLSPTERRFCELLITGPYPENATRTYQLLHPDANDGTAGSAGPLLKNEPRIQKYLIALRGRAIAGSEKELIAELKDWIRVAVKAKRLLEAHVEGTRRLTGTDLAIIREVLDRALGRSVEKVEADIGSRLDNLIKELAAKRRNNNGHHEFGPPGTPLELPVSVETHEGGTLGDPE